MVEYICVKEAQKSLENNSVNSKIINLYGVVFDYTSPQKSKGSGKSIWSVLKQNRLFCVELFDFLYFVYFFVSKTLTKNIYRLVLHCKTSRSILSWWKIIENNIVCKKRRTFTKSNIFDTNTLFDWLFSAAYKIWTQNSL